MFINIYIHTHLGTTGKNAHNANLLRQFRWKSQNLSEYVSKHNESMDPSCIVTTVQAGGGGVMVWGMFSWHTLGPLVPIGHL